MVKYVAVARCTFHVSELKRFTWKFSRSFNSSHWACVLYLWNKSHAHYRCVEYVCLLYALDMAVYATCVFPFDKILALLQ